MPLAGPVGPSRAFRFRATREDKPMTARNPAAPHAALPRVAALVGPYTAGKTTLLEALLFAAGALPRKGSVANGSSLGDAAPEARSRQMTIEPNIACCIFLDDPWIFLDCTGSVELAKDTDRKSTRLNSSH